MLVLSRKEGESVMIGENISITILSIDPGGQVNIGISAPRDVLVLRSELQKAVCENQHAPLRCLIAPAADRPPGRSAFSAVPPRENQNRAGSRRSPRGFLL